jgi:hypothetical protein
MKFLPRATLLPLLFVTAGSAAEKTGLPKNSPFAPVGVAAAPVETANERIEFAGVSSVGKKTDLIFYDKTARKSHWIAKGETKEGIEVLNYDEPRAQAVVKINGTEKTLSLRKGARVAGPRPVGFLPAASGFATPTSLPSPAVLQKTQSSAPDAPAASMQPIVTPAQPAQPATPEAQAQLKAETEARMLVSDLLEIGMAQRKAYEEAQRRAADGNTQSSTTPNTPQAPPVDPTQPARP